VEKHAHADSVRGEGPGGGEDEAAIDEEVEGAEEECVVLDPEVHDLEGKLELGGVRKGNGECCEKHVVKSDLKSFGSSRVILRIQTVEVQKGDSMAWLEHICQNAPPSQRLIDQLCDQVDGEDDAEEVFGEVEGRRGL